MRLSRLCFIASCLAFATVVAIGCGGVNGKYCSQGQTDCVGSGVARMCAPDGTWVQESCGAGYACMAGSCASLNDMACNAVQNTCTDSTHAMVCNDNGVGFKSVACPTGTTCQGLGECVGTCVVGESTCKGINTVQTCTDGFTVMDSQCTPGMTACVTTTDNGAGTLQTAACKPLGCTPGDEQCGNKAADPNSTDPGYDSTCVSSPSGYHWQSEQCATGASCSPGAGCSQICIPGATRCLSGGIQTCQANGTWNTPTPCTETSTGQQQTCMILNDVAVCGDPLCAQGNPGACESDGFHPCVNGKVSATGAACSFGVCTVLGGNIDGFQPGACLAQCNPGDSRCDGNLAYEACAANGVWSGTTQSCSVGTCQQWVDSNTDIHTVCGVCVPNTQRCTDSGGNAAGTPLTDIETCSASGQWSNHTACAVGICENNVNGTGYAACVAQCTPNTTICMGGAASCTGNSSPPPNHCGTTSWGTCNANGTLPPAGTACPGGESCRTSQNGQTVGVGANACVQCVGPNIPGGNEVGLVDSWCTATASPGSLEICNVNNQWPTPSACSTTAPANGTCTQETQRISGETPSCPFFCDNIILGFFGTSCQGQYGVGTQTWGGDPNCCATPSCEQYATSTTAAPAACN